MAEIRCDTPEGREITRVLLDGNEVPFAFALDREAGWIDRYRTDGEYPARWIPPGSTEYELQPERLYGVVTVERKAGVARS